MTTSEAAALVLDLTQQVRDTRRECDAYRLLAQQAITYAHQLQNDLATVEKRYHRLLDEREQDRDCRPHPRMKVSA